MTEKQIINLPQPYLFFIVRASQTEKRHRYMYIREPYRCSVSVCDALTKKKKKKKKKKIRYCTRIRLPHACTCTVYHFFFPDRHFVYARFTLADPMPRLCPDAVGSANVNGLPTRNWPSGPHREAIGRSSGNIKHV